MNEDTDIERLVRYLDNEMSEEERIHLENEMAEDNKLKAELDAVRTSQKAVRHYGITTDVSRLHKEMMKELKEPMADKPAKSRLVNMFSSPLKIAAAIVIVLFAAGLIEYFSLSSQSIFSSQYITYELPNLRGDSVTHTTTSYYQEKKYDLYINAFEKLATPSTEEKFMAGISYIELNQPQKAIDQLGSIQTASVAALQQQELDYYLALAYLRNNEPSQAYSIFEKIYNDTSHAYHDRVSKWLLIKLKMLSFKTK
ncbi:MAG: hypothetical protein QM802_13860 [Agriterribacter sp.]